MHRNKIKSKQSIKKIILKEKILKSFGKDLNTEQSS